MKSYFDSIKDLANKVPESLADFSKPRKDSQLPYVFNLACFSSLMQAYRFFKHGIYNKRTGVCKALT